MIYLHTLGDALITIGEKEIRPTSPMLFAALLYLGLERGRRVPRAALQELLFPNADERSGAHSLRQLLYKLRQLGAPIEADGNVVLLRAEQVQDDRTAETNFTNGNAKHAERFALGLLPDYAPNLSERYDEWLEHQRASVSASVRRQLVAAMSASRTSIDWTAVERFAQLILQIDPFNEEATLALAEATALSGSKSEALMILTRYEKETGRGDLKLSSSVLRRRISERVPDTKHRALQTPFVGREADAEAIRNGILRARGGTPSLLVIAGEPGIGKTRLLEETAAFAALEGLHVQIVRCHPQHANRPLGVFLELVPALLSCRGALGVSPQSMAHLNLLTSHRDDRGDRPADARDDATRSDVLLTALRDLIDAVASETPLLLGIDDAHWADGDSIRELSAFTQTTSGRSLVLILSTRSLEKLTTGLVPNAPTVVRRLKPLSEAPMAQLARHLLPHHDGADLDAVGEWCIQTAAGNPLFLRTLCAHYAETGLPFSVPPDLVSATKRRLEQLPQESKRLLQFCTLLGRHSSVARLQAVSEVSHLQLLDVLERLEEEGFLQFRGEAVRVSHDLLGDCVLELLPPATRRAVHAYIASHLERGFETSHDAALLWDCSEQWVKSGDTDKAVEFLRRCALHAADLGRAAQALKLLERAMELVTNPLEKAEVLRDMMISGKAAGHWSEVHRCSQQLAALSAESPTHSDIELLSVEACWMMSFQVGDATTRLLACASAVTADPNHRLDAAILLMRIAHERGDVPLARSAYESVETLLTNTGYSSRLLPIIYHTSFGDRDRALEAARALRRDLASFQPITLQFRAGFNIATAFAYLGEREALDLYRELYDLACELGMKAWQRQFASSLCWWQLDYENIDAAEEWYERTEGSRPGELVSTAETRTNVACACEIALRRHDVPRAREMILRLRAVGAAESVRAAIYINTVEIRLLQLDQSTLSTDEEIGELMRTFDTGRTLIGVDFVVVALGEALRRRGRQREARAILDVYAREYRRERSPLPQSFLTLRDRISMEIRPPLEHASAMLSGCANDLHVVTRQASHSEESS